MMKKYVRDFIGTDSLTDRTVIFLRGNQLNALLTTNCWDLVLHTKGRNVCHLHYADINI